MQASSSVLPELTTSFLNLLVFEANPCDVALDATQVLQLSPREDFSGTCELEFERVLGVSPRNPTSPRVLTLKGAPAGCGIITSFAMRVLRMPAGSVVPMPASLFGAQLFDSVVLGGSAPTALVVDTVQLVRLLESTSQSKTSSVDKRHL